MQNLRRNSTSLQPRGLRSTRLLCPWALPLRVENSIIGRPTQNCKIHLWKLGQVPTVSIREKSPQLWQGEGRGANLDRGGVSSSERGLPAGRTSYPEPNLLRLHGPLTDLGRGKCPAQPPPQPSCPSKGKGDLRNTVKGIVQRHRKTDRTSKGHFPSPLSSSHYKQPTDSSAFTQGATSSRHKAKPNTKATRPGGRKDDWKTQSKPQNQRNCNYEVRGLKQV